MTTAETRREALAAQLLNQPRPSNILGVLEQRDAIDRVAGVENDDVAQRLITLALSVDDETMVRALLHGAYRYRWHHAVAAYAEGRPENATAAMELWQLTAKDE
ncbi:Uncharacterised protein [Mycobacteroides abscessus subsp. bolletii]|uniref:hypothetical protein n=1 Tax=Mycobacteroides abscessus TaxID=36809 RepID=UPI00092B7D8D|nr:hypothetical protein [Mycobacteroides abscessus]SIJ76686.1 Uncharacterised protein [Mycobacteroides abscessus subsp. bolletii]